jgi:hypothetical protein
MADSFIGQANLPLGLRNNNPGDLRPGDEWQGMIGVNEGFIVFSDITWGIRALVRDLVNAINEGFDTITTLITHYAPPSENDTAGYIASVSSDTGLDPGLQLGTDPDTLSSLVRAIMNKELSPGNSALVSDADIQEGVNMAGSAATSLVQAVPVALEAAVNTVTGQGPAGVDGSGVAIGVGVVAGLLILGLIFRKKL